MTAPQELTRFQDAIDAFTFAREWIEGVALDNGFSRPGPCTRRFENYSHDIGDGGTLAFFRDDRPIAVAVVLRDAWNYSVVMQVYAQEDGSKQDSGTGAK